MPLGINDKDRIGSDRRSFFRMVKGLDRIADPFLTKGSGSDRRSRKKGSFNSLNPHHNENLLVILQQCLFTFAAYLFSEFTYLNLIYIHLYSLIFNPQLKAKYLI